MTSRTGTQSLSRSVALLREIALRSRQGATLMELVASTQLDRSTAHRMLKCLVAEQLLDYHPGERRYRLGPLIFQMGIASGDMYFRDAAAPTLSRLAEETGDTVFLMMLSGWESLCVDRREGSYPVKTFVVDVGTRRPLGMGAAALALLSALPDTQVDEALAANAARVPRYEGLFDAERLWQMVRKTRAQQYSSMDVIGVPGVRAVGYPVCLAGGRVVAAISIAAIEPRMTPTREKVIAAMIRNAVEHLVALLNKGRTAPSASRFGQG